MYLVIFDVDGTLVDSQQIIHEAMVRTFVSHGFEPLPIERNKQIIGLTLDVAIAQLLGRNVDALSKEMSDTYKGHYLELLKVPEMKSPFFEGIETVVEALAQRDQCFMAVATGKSRRGLDRLLETPPLDGRITVSRTADDCPSKPHPAMILECCAHIGIKPERTIMVGDTSFDMEMARAAGAKSLGVTWGYHDSDRLRQGGAMNMVTGAHQVVGAIDQLLEN